MDPGVSQAMVEDDGRTRHLASSNTAVLLHQRTQRIFPVCTAWTAHEDTTNNGGAYSSCDIVGARGSQHNKQMNLGRRSKRLKNDRIERILVNLDYSEALVIIFSSREWSEGPEHRGGGP